MKEHLELYAEVRSYSPLKQSKNRRRAEPSSPFASICAILSPGSACKTHETASSAPAFQSAIHSCARSPIP